MRTGAITLAIAGTFTALAALAGCGGGTDTSSIATVSSETSTTQSLPRSQFIQQADGICAESNAAVAAIVPGSTAGEQAASASQELAVSRDELSSIRSLGTPQGASPAAFIAALTKVNDQLARERLALQRNDAGALAGIASNLDAAQTKAQSAAAAYGFKKCGATTAPSGATIAGTGSTTAPAPATTTTVAPTTTTTPTVITPTTTAPVPPPPPNGGAGSAPPTTTAPPSGNGSGDSGGIGAG